MGPLHWFLLGAMTAWTPSLLLLAIALWRYGEHERREPRNGSSAVKETPLPPYVRRIRLAEADRRELGR
jgi:hypothetical protein